MTPIAARLMLLALLVGAHASAQEFEEFPEPDWIPSIDVGLEVFAWESDDSVQNLVNGPLWSASESNSLTQLLVTIGGELAGPPLKSFPGRPRVVLGGGIGIPTENADRTIDIGDPVNSVNPEQDIAAYMRRLETAIRRNCLTPPGDPPPPPTCPEPEVEEFNGQGSDIRVSLDNPTWYANLGVSFDIPLFDTTLLQVRPSVAYRGEKLDLAGRLTTVTLDEFILADPPTVDFTIHRSRTPTKNFTHHHLGPRLELALVLSTRARPMWFEVVITPMPRGLVR